MTLIAEQIQLGNCIDEMALSTDRLLTIYRGYLQAAMTGLLARPGTPNVLQKADSFAREAMSRELDFAEQTYLRLKAEEEEENK